MRIVFLAPGEIEIPPNGWGALETVVWNQYNEFKKLNYDVHIINEKDSEVAFNKIIQINPDIIHLHYGSHYHLMPRFKCRKLITTHDGRFKFSLAFHNMIVSRFTYDCEFFCLTSWEKDFLLKIGISENKIKIIPNGVATSNFVFNSNPSLKNKTICLGKIDDRKRQAQLQSLNLDINFVGENHSNIFDVLDESYIGAWSRKDVYEKLTEYANLILISRSELQPLVCLEALSAGLGLIINEECSQNLDISKKFISIVDDDILLNKEKLKLIIDENREYSLNNRDEIIEYAKTFDWKEIAKIYINNL